MDVSYIVLYAGLFIVTLLCLSRLFAIVLSKILSAVIKKDISIDYVGVVSFKNVSIQLNHSSSLAIDAIWLTWKLFNPNQTRPVVLHVGDIRIQADIGQNALGLQTTKRTKDVPNTANSQGSSILESGYLVSTVKFIIQVLSVDIEAINLMLLHVNTMGIDSLLHVTINNIRLSGEVLTDKILSTDFSLDQAAVRVLRSAQQEANKQSDVGQASTKFKMSTVLNIVDKAILGLSVYISDPQVSLHDGCLLPPNYALLDVSSDTQSVSNRPSTPTAEKITAICKQIPKDTKIQIDNICFKINLQMQQRSLKLNSKKVCFIAELDSDYMIPCSKNGELFLPSATGQFFCTDVLLTNLQARKLFSLTNVTTDMQIRETGISADISVRHCHSNYADKEFSFWAHVIKEYQSKRRLSRPYFGHQAAIPKADITIEQAKPSNFIEQFCLPVDVTFDLNDLSSHMIWPKLPSCLAALASLRSAVHITTDAEASAPGSVTQKPFRYIRGSIQGEQLCCQIGDSMRIPGGAVPGKHVWGTPCAINTVNIKVNITPMLLEVEGAVQSLQLESSQELHQVIQHCIETLTGLRSSMSDGRKKPRVRPVEASISRPTRRYQVLVRLEDIDAFVCSDIPECLTLRVDTVEVDASPSFSAASIEGIKLRRIKPNSKICQCLAYNKLQEEGIVDVKEIMCKHTAKKKRLLVEVQEKCDMSWTTTTHMNLYHHAKEIITFVKNTKEIVSPKQETDDKLAAEIPPAESSSQRSKDSLNLALNVRKLVINYDVSPTQRNNVIVNELYGEKGKEVLKATSSNCVICFDGHPIFTIKSACMEKLVNNPQLLDDRQSFDNLTLTTNRAWGVFAKSLEVVFPYQYDFAANYTGIINLKKWFKMLHSSKKGPSYEEPMYADVLIRIQTISLQICDDPFEIKLGDNYELMKDEKKESKLREELLDEKVSELRQTHGELLPAKRIDELYTALERKNMDIYVKRSQRLYSGSPMRKALLMLTVTGAELSALADPSMNGKENIVRHMKEIDTASPYPEGDLDFTTLWCRMIRGTAKTLDLQLRDYPQSLWEMEDWHFWGRVVGSEQVGATRAKRECTVEVGEPWGNVTVTRSMPALKFYHDLATDVTAMHLAYGPTMEPGWSTVNLSMNLLNKPSVDPSKQLPFWDKMRLLFHGRLTASVQQCNMLWLATQDPHDSSECLDWEWKNIYLDWTNAHWLLKGDLDVYVRTASKYDDVRLLHFPNFRFDIGIEWLCNGDLNDHHSVMPCAPDKVPEHSPNQLHDSYAAFRTQNLNLKLSLDIKGRKEEDGKPECLFYSTTMRWLQNFQTTTGNVSRPTKSGKLFNNSTPRKLQLSRHYKCIDFNAKFPTFQVNYWASFNKQRGIELCLGKGSFSSKHGLHLVELTDGLKHRPRADWSTIELDFDIGESHGHLYTAAQNNDITQGFTKPPADKHHMATVARVVYCRQQSESNSNILNPDLSNEDLDDMDTSEMEDNEKNEEKDFTHKLVVTEFCGSWTRFNRDAVIGLYDSYNKAQVLKHNLSTEALKEIKVDSSAAPITFGHGGSTPTPQGSSSANTPSPMTKLQTGYGATLLNQLLSEATTKFMVFSEENAGGKEQLYGMKACTTNDVMMKNWHIELCNSQVLLKGYETTGYAIVCAVNMQLTNCSHWPALRDNQLTSKTTWVAKLDGLQYFATVESSTGSKEVKWIPLSIIERTISSQHPTDVPDMVGSGESVGGVVSDTVGASSEDTCGESGVQLQRIMSRCNCQVYYASYGGNVDPNIAAQIIHPDANKNNEDEEEDGLWSKEEAVDSMTLVYHDLDMCTNSSQYEMIMDIINNLLLYVEPKRKEAMARMQHMRFALQLSTTEDQKMPIVQLQNSLRNLLSELRQVEKNLHNKQRALEDVAMDANLYEQIRDLEIEVSEKKEAVATASENLRIMVSCFKEIQLQRAMKRKLEQAQQSIKVIRRVEVCIGLAKWRLTEEDGQLGIADLQLRQFKYTRTSKSDDSGENLMELGWVYINNLIGNDIYKDVLRPTEATIKGKQVALRVIARGKPPVGGISVIENFEVNVVPLNIQLSFRFFKKMMAFFFPGRDVDHTPSEEQIKGVDDEPEPIGRFSRTGSIRSTSSSESIEGTLSREPTTKTIKRSFFFQRQKGDIDKMKERAARNNTFFYIKIPAVPLCVSYKGEKDKNIEDVTNFHLTLPSLEYHNCTWTWLDLLMAMKKEYKQALLSQAIKEKLKFRIVPREDPNTGTDTSSDADKSKLLMGPKASSIATEEKSSKRALFGKGPSNH